ncbi:hypothetical protein IG631_18794 [Alternaria alternata]|nr:hypothetical protein IG631_18794 [Alternaria alternata]
MSHWSSQILTCIWLVGDVPPIIRPIQQQQLRHVHPPRPDRKSDRLLGHAHLDRAPENGTKLSCEACHWGSTRKIHIAQQKSRDYARAVKRSAPTKSLQQGVIPSKLSFSRIRGSGGDWFITECEM